MGGINVKALAILVAIVALTGAGLYGLHEYQGRRNAAKMEQAALDAERKGRLDRTQMFLDRYLYFRPDDADALARYGKLLAKNPTRESRENAMLLLERALRADRTRRDDRRELAEYALELGRYQDVNEHAGTILKDDDEAKPKRFDETHGVAEYLLGRCEEAEGTRKHDVEAERLYRLALTHAPHDLRIYPQLALLLRLKYDPPRVEEADKIVDAMVAAQAKESRAYVVRSLYRARFHLPGAEEDALRALELAPDDANIILLAASHAVSRKDWARGRRYLEHGLKANPQDPRLYLYKADLELAAGSPGAAENELLRGINALPAVDHLRFQLAKVLIELRRLTEAEELLVNLYKSGFEPEQVALARARIVMYGLDWGGAAEQLEKIQPLVATDPVLSRQVNGDLIQCYERLAKANRRDQAVIRKLRAAYARLLAPLKGADETYGETLIAYGRTLESLGLDDEAMEQYFQAAAAKVPAAKVAIAGLLIRRTMAAPANRAGWADVEKALADAATAVPDSPLVAIQHAGALAARGRFDEAQDLLEKACAKHPEQLENWLAREALLERRGALDAIPPVLDDAVKALGDRIELRLVRIRYLGLRGGPAAARAIDALAEGLDQRPEVEQEWLLASVADAHEQLGDAKGALAWWGRLAKRRPGDLIVQLQAFDFALAANDAAARDTARDRIRELEGSDRAFSTFAEVARLIREAQRGDRSGLEKARTLLEKVANLRPAWSRVPLARAQVEDLAGRPDDALDYYLQAIEAGERGPTVVRRAVEQLYQTRRYSDADKLLASLQAEPLVAGEVRRRAAEISARNRDFDRALALAQDVVSAESRDYRDHLWLARMLAGSGRRAEAEDHFRRAVTLAPAEPAPRLLLVSFLATGGHKAAADAAVREAEAALDPQKHPVELARCHALAGHAVRARELFQAALATDPDDEVALRDMIDLLVANGWYREAEPHLEHLIALKGESEAAESVKLRSILARILAAQLDPERARRALALVDPKALQAAPADGSGDVSSSAAADEPAVQIRARVEILAAMAGGARRAEAIALMERLVARDQESRDRQRLAELYEEQGNWPKARAVLIDLARAHARDAKQLGRVIAALLKHGEADTAAPWVAAVERFEPRSLRAAEARAALLAARGKKADAVAPLREFAAGGDQEAVDAALAMERLNLLEPAEALLNEAAARKPDARLALAHFLGRRGRLAEGLDACEAAAAAGSPPEVVAATSLTLANSPKADDALRARAERWIEEALRKQPAATKLLLPLAEIRQYRTHYAQAAETYRSALKADSNDVMALNNLAWLLAHEPDRRPEARTHIDRAIALAGPLPALLDTRGSIALEDGQVDVAIRDFQDAIASEPATAVFRLHLAQAYLAAGRGAEAADAFAKARQLGLDPAGLDPLDRPAYDRLSTKLATASRP